MKADIECRLICTVKDSALDLPEELNNKEIYNFEDKEYEIVKAEIKSWELAEALDLMFDKAKIYFDKLKRLANENKIQIYVDVCIYHYEKYPALVIEGNAMENIRELKADIGIDMY